jgi:hypothetical protein
MADDARRQKWWATVARWNANEPGAAPCTHSDRVEIGRSTDAGGTEIHTSCPCGKTYRQYIPAKKGC